MKKLLTLLPLLTALLPAYADVWDGYSADTSWYQSEQTEFHIYTAAQLAGLEQLVNRDTIDFYGCRVLLEEDINLGNHPWNPIGYGTRHYASSLNGFRQGGNAFCFNGTFDGQGHSVSNLSITTAEIGYFSSGVNHGVALGLFGTSDVGVFQNLHVAAKFTLNGMASNAYRIVELYLGGIIGRGGNIRQCSSKAEINTYEILDCSKYYIGYLAGKADEVTACSADGTLYHWDSSIFYDTNTGESYFGGVVGFANTVRQCASAGEVGCTVYVFSNGSCKVGGVCGFASLIEDCIFSGKIDVALRNASYNRSLVYGISPCERPSSSDATCIVRNVISAPESFWTDAQYAWQRGLVTQTNRSYITVENAYFQLEQTTGNEKGTSANRETLVAGIPLDGLKTSVWRFEAGKLPSLKSLEVGIQTPKAIQEPRLIINPDKSLAFENLKGRQRLLVYDCSGKLLISRNIEASSRIHLEQGIYIIRVGNQTYKISL